MIQNYLMSFSGESIKEWIIEDEKKAKEQYWNSLSDVKKSRLIYRTVYLLQGFSEEEIVEMLDKKFPLEENNAHIDRKLTEEDVQRSQ